MKRGVAIVLIISVFLILSVNIVSASVNINVDVDRGFSAGETVRFSYTFTSDTDEVIVYTPQIKCVDGYSTLLTDIQLSLSKGIPVTKTFEGFEVTEDTAAEQCLAIIKIKRPFTQVKEKVFEIMTESDLHFYLLGCKDVLCSEKTNIFLKNENIYLGYGSSVSGISIVASLKYPDGKSKEITLPTSINAEQIGSYELDATASKEGYKPITKTMQFGVIGKNAEIQSSSISQQDTSGGVGKENNGQIGAGYTIIVILLVLIIFIVIISYFLWRNFSKFKK